MLRGVNRQGVFEEPEDYREGWNQKTVPMIPLKDINGTSLMDIRREDGTSVYGQLKTGK